MQLEPNTPVQFGDTQAQVLGYKSGWYTVQLADGTNAKARAKQLQEVETPAPDKDNASDETDDQDRDMKAQMKKARSRYQRVKNYAGESSMDCGDDVASLLRGLEPEEVCRLADEVLNEAPGTHAKKYGHLNRGQQRMNSGNRIRGALRKETVSPKDVRKAYEALGLQAMGQDAA